MQADLFNPDAIMEEQKPEIVPLKKAIQQVFALMKNEQWYTLQQIEKETRLERPTIMVSLASLKKDANVLTLETLKHAARDTPTRYKLIPKKR